jgi:hypothetical protein
VELVAGLATSCLLLLPLFNPGAVGGGDFASHVWLLDYYGAYLKAHLSFPPTININEYAGAVNPIFYGPAFYQIGGLIAAICGGAIAFRITALLGTLIQFVQVARAYGSMGAPRSIAIIGAAALTLNIYSMTNLYQRGALTEFVAIEFVTAALASIVIAVRRRKLVDVVLSGFLFTLAATGHPLTGLFGGIFLLLVATTALVASRSRWLLAHLVGQGLLSLLVLSAWLYLMATLGRQLQVPAAEWFLGWGHLPLSIDAWWSRLSPVPLDWRSVVGGLEVEHGTPYLEAQVSVPLILLAGLCALLIWRHGYRRDEPRDRFAIWLGLLATILFVLTLTFSLEPSWSLAFGRLFTLLQFPYRLTAYTTISVLLLSFALARLVDWRAASVNSATTITVFISICGTIAALGAYQKFVHAAAVLSAGPPNHEPQAILARPLKWFPAAKDYTVIAGFAQTSVSQSEDRTELAFPITATFGVPEPIVVDVSKPMSAVLALNPFPWNRVSVDGAALPTDVIRIDRETVPRQTIRLQPGRHVIEYQFTPGRIWSMLNGISRFTLIGWIGFVVLARFLSIRGDRAADEGEAPEVG